MLFIFEVLLVFSCISNQVVTDTIALPQRSNCFQALSVSWHMVVIFQVRTIDESHVTEKCFSCIMSTCVQVDSQLKGNRVSMQGEECMQRLHSQCQQEKAITLFQENYCYAVVPQFPLSAAYFLYLFCYVALIVLFTSA